VTFFANLGYQFKLRGGVIPEGGVLLANAMPAHQLMRRKMFRFPHLTRRLFDPQLYLAGLDAARARGHCANLASYPWFGIQRLEAYSSSLQNQKDWKTEANSSIARLWPGCAPQDRQEIGWCAREAIEFQLRLGVEALIAPSPLTTDPASNYELELAWLDESISAVRATTGRQSPKPVFATIAISDIALRYSKPEENRFVEQVLDAVSAREIDGVYLIVEQASEQVDAKLCATSKTLESVLHMIHVLKSECSLNVVVNFFGAFGLVCSAVGADRWVSGWYKSETRLRLDDKYGTGRSYPAFWSHRAAIDIHLESELDWISETGSLAEVEDETVASIGLLSALRGGGRVEQVVDWRHRQSNINAASEHFFRSVIREDKRLSVLTSARRLEVVNEWLHVAEEVAIRIQKSRGAELKSRLTHVGAWATAVRSHIERHGA
jgi:hypothetical protein